MKKLLSTVCLASVILTGHTQLVLIDISTPHTNTTTGSGLISLPGICTNAHYTTLNTSNVTYGDFLGTAFAKVNSNLTWLASNATNTFNALLHATNLTVSTNWITTQTYYIAGTMVASNTWTWFSLTNGHGKGDIWDANSNGVMKWTFLNAPTGVVTLGHIP